MNHCPNCGYALTHEPAAQPRRGENFSMTRAEAEALARAKILTWDILGSEHPGFEWNQLIIQAGRGDDVLIREFLANFRSKQPPVPRDRGDAP